jgi:SAM-dependent methyltransferase
VPGEVEHHATEGIERVYASTARYYQQKIARFGPSPAGVDWRCEPTQQLRFVQLLKLCDLGRNFTLNDVGCGYGALLGYLAQRRKLHRVDYFGIDLAPAMIEAARAAWPRHRNKFTIGACSPRVADYSVASGIFNVRLDIPFSLWELFIERTLSQMRQTSRLGFAVNFLAPVPRGISSPSELYRAPPGAWAAYCKKNFGAAIEQLSGYGLHEETLLVRY